MNRYQIGCVADDFTGASDIASFFRQGGMRCLLINGLPPEGFQPPDCDAIVIALKCRSIEPEQAVEQTQCAFQWLAEKGFKTLYYKYCSTFDSTPKGNIGPVLDGLLETFDLPYTILCPALPVNGRVVRGGKLYVNGILLEESSMRHHPLNPMLHSSIPVLMEAQSKYPCYVMDREMLWEDEAEIFARISRWRAESPRFYISVDYCDEEDGRRIAALFGKERLLSGGSALAAYLGCAEDKTNSGPMDGRRADGRVLMLSGSCSQATCTQVAAYLNGGGRGMRIDPVQLLDGRQGIEDLWRFAEDHGNEDVLFYSSQPAEERSIESEDIQNRISCALEKMMAELARRALERGVKKLVVAGGETSGAVIQALGWKCFNLGDSVAPGVPMLFPLQDEETCLILKSGNFGQPDFFDRAAEMMRMIGLKPE